MSSACRCSSTISTAGTDSPLRQLLHARRPLRRAARRALASASPTTSSISSGSFEEHVVSDFVREYAAGRTPIPCVHCNGDLKFASLVERARGLRRRAVATGHYARVERDPATGRYRLLRGVDRAKDQSYFLFTLSQEQLARAQFPVGDLDKAASARKRARSDWPSRRSRTARRSASSPPASTRNSSTRRADAPARRLIRDATGACSARTPACTASRSASARASASPSPVPLYVVDIDADDGRRHGRPARGAGAHDADGLAGELDRRVAHRRQPSAPP